MKQFKLDKMTKGWFIGPFEPTCFKTNHCEIAVKFYKTGDFEPSHFHKIAHELTLVVEGDIRMAGKDFSKGDIIYLEPGEVADFLALSDSTTVVVKIPGILDDKYLVR